MIILFCACYLIVKYSLFIARLVPTPSLENHLKKRKEKKLFSHLLRLSSHPSSIHHYLASITRLHLSQSWVSGRWSSILPTCRVFHRWAGIPARVSITVFPVHFLVSIPVSKKGLAFWKSQSQSWKRDWSFKSLDSSLEKGIQALKILRYFFLEKLNYTIKIWVESLNPSLDHCDPLQFISLDPSLEKVIDILKVLIPVSKRDWHIESFDPSLEKVFGVFKVSIPVSKKGLWFWKSRSCLDFQNPVSLIIGARQVQMSEPNLLPKILGFKDSVGATNCALTMSCHCTVLVRNHCTVEAGHLYLMYLVYLHVGPPCPASTVYSTKY